MRWAALLLTLCCAGALGQQPAPAVAVPPASEKMEFSDGPDFKIAGVTDWTAVGGHGSDATLRTSEDLALETLALKARVGVGVTFSVEQETRLRSAVAAAPGDARANRTLGEYYLHTAHYREAILPLERAEGSPEDERDLALACGGMGDWAQARRHIEKALSQKDMAEFHRVAGDIDEHAGDPLAAVGQDEQAARLDPSEENYFQWGSELLLHRAVWQAAEVFKQGAALHPRSARMRTGWGSALFAGALYDDAAERLCEASDLAPANPEAYLFLGKVEIAAPAPLPCVEAKLARFAQAQPANADANYYYAMALSRQGKDPAAVEQLLTKTVTIDPHYAAAYLQLGILAYDAHDLARAIEFYGRAIAADPQLAEAHYRLAVAYDRRGERERAAAERQTHDQIARAQADAVEQQRRGIKQFSVETQVKQP